MQSARQATACRLLPPVHWALLYTIGALFVSTFILFETGGSFSNEGRHILFTVLCGLMSFVLVARPSSSCCFSHGLLPPLLRSPELALLPFVPVSWHPRTSPRAGVCGVSCCMGVYTRLVKAWSHWNFFRMSVSEAWRNVSMMKVLMFPELAW